MSGLVQDLIQEQPDTVSILKNGQKWIEQRLTKEDKLVLSVDPRFSQDEIAQARMEIKHVTSQLLRLRQDLTYFLNDETPIQNKEELQEKSIELSLD